MIHFFIPFPLLLYFLLVCLSFSLFFPFPLSFFLFEIYFRIFLYSFARKPLDVEDLKVDFGFVESRFSVSQVVFVIRMFERFCTRCNGA